MVNKKPTALRIYTARKAPSKMEIIEAMKDDPRFLELHDKHWKALAAEWDIGAETGKPAKLAHIARRAGVNYATIKNWICRRDYLEAQVVLSQQVLQQWKPVLVGKALKDALNGNQRMLMFFMERIFPKLEPAPENSQGTQVQINVPWGGNPADNRATVLEIVPKSVEPPQEHPQEMPPEDTAPEEELADDL